MSEGGRGTGNRSADQPLRLQRRNDLRIQPVEGPEGRRYSVKDPISLRYCQLREDECFLLKQLDGSISLSSLRERYQERCSPHRVSLRALQDLLFRFHQLELVVAGTVGQGEQLHRRSSRRRWQQTLATLQSLLFVRFPGVDPEPLLRCTYPAVRWVFRPVSLFLAACFGCLALLVVGLHLEQWLAEYPRLSRWGEGENLLLLAVAMAASKVVHELGHAYTCKHFGGECHEIGPMLLVFTPALYCDTSDSWMLPNRWHRAAVGAAGMLVECWLAAVATFVWWYSEPGPLHLLTMQIMVVCSISTIVFNANPLLRYDGYYILSDLAGVPNLAQRAKQRLGDLSGRWLLGIRAPSRPSDTSSAAPWLVWYAVAAFLYRWALTIAILWFVSRFLRPYNLESVGWMLCAVVVVGMVASPLRESWRFLRTPGSWQRLSLPRLVTTGLLAAALIGLLFLPFSRHVNGEVTIVPRNLQPVYVAVEGVLVETDVEPGQQVQRGDQIAQLQNRSLQRQLIQARQQQRSQQLLVEQLRATQGIDPEATGRLPAAESALEDLRQRVEKLIERSEALTMIAPRSGLVTAGRRVIRAGHRAAEGTNLNSWSGQPTDPSNRGGFFAAGVEFCGVADSGRYEARLLVDQSEVAMIAPGQPTLITLAGMTDQPLRGIVHSLAARPFVESEEATDRAPAEVSRRSNESGSRRYEVRIRLAESKPKPINGLGGRGRVLVQNQSLAERLYRAVAATLRFR